MGFEPTTSCLEGKSSTTELHPRLLAVPSILRVGGEGFEPPKGVARQIYSLMQLSTLPSARAPELPVGIEPTTYGLQNRCTTVVLR